MINKKNIIVCVLSTVFLLILIMRFNEHYNTTRTIVGKCQGTAFSYALLKKDNTFDIYSDNSRVFPTKHPITCVSGYWKVLNKHGHNKYLEWFKNTLKINCPFVIFGNKEGIDVVRQFRINYPTYYVILNIEDFITYKYRDKIQIHDIHLPSKDLGLIWNEKIFLLQRSNKLNIFNSDFYCWYDAGICVYRDIYPSQKILGYSNFINTLPTDKLIFTSSDSPNFEKNKMNDLYYHYVSGSLFMLHKNIIDNGCYLYDKACFDSNILTTDQCILTKLYEMYPFFFYNIGHGYGKLIELFFEKY